MSLDLCVYNKKKAPTEPIEFLKWFYERTTWDGDRDYYDTKGTDQDLVDFFLEMVKICPAMNGPYAPSKEEIEENPELEDSPLITEYSIGEDLIYMGFSYNAPSEVFVQLEEIAYKHGLGYFDMFFMHLDAKTKINVPQISKEQLEKGITEEIPKKNESILKRIFRFIK
ncbi:hypothetical protein SAMN02910370_02796 [Lachnospiraceae bacterium XPB1003]|nr:hypothetical protein SAMN02910370_02796 [Lachnospiraceae bacterium XPB1003]